MKQPRYRPSKLNVAHIRLNQTHFHDDSMEYDKIKCYHIMTL